MSKESSAVVDQPRRGGRQTNYRPEFAAVAAGMCRLGATDTDLAHEFEVTVVTIWHWKNRHEDFAAAVKLGKDAADERVERSLYQRAVGGVFDSVKVFSHDGDTFEHPIKEHVQPDTTAAIFWLKNRRPEKWRDRHELTGANGAPLVPIGPAMSAQEAAEAYYDTVKNVTAADPRLIEHAPQPTSPPAKATKAKKRVMKK